TPLAPSSRIFASSSTGLRSTCRRSSLSSSAIRALIVTKLISIALTQRGCEGDADASHLHPAHLCPHAAAVKQLEMQAFADVGDILEDDHCSGRRDVDQTDHMLAATEIEHRRARQRRVTDFGPLVDASRFCARDHRTVEKII